MVSTREHLRALLDAERRRINLAIGVAWSAIAFVYYEMGRRQRLGEERETTRREYVDDELAKLNNDALAHRERATGRASIGRTFVTIAGVALTVVTILSLLWSANAI